MSHSPKACRDLEKAANMFSKATRIKEVLLVINLIGAGTATSSQLSLKWPYVLVRSEEVPLYYSKHFDSLVSFARQRHLINES